MSIKIKAIQRVVLVYILSLSKLTDSFIDWSVFAVIV